MVHFLVSRANTATTWTCCETLCECTLEVARALSGVTRVIPVVLGVSSVRPSGLTSQSLGWQVAVVAGAEASAFVSVRLFTQWMKSLASGPSKQCRF